MSDDRIRLVAKMTAWFLVFGVPTISMTLAVHYQNMYWLALCLLPISLMALAPRQR